MTNNIKPEILILSNEQFGYLVDYYYYAKYLSSFFNITFICPDDNLKRIEVPEIKIIYLPKTSGWKRRLAYREILKSLIKQNCRFDLIMIGVKGGFILYDLLRKLSAIVVNDIRTLDISDSKFKRNIANAMITFESCNANSTTVISELVAKKLHLKKGKYTILPLGGNIIECENKCFDNISLIYVGTFFNRNIEVTIEGLAMYLQRHPEMCGKIHYDIIGSGQGEDKIVAAISANKMEAVVTMHGYIENHRLPKYFAKANVGVSYVPINSKYDLQHPTKTYEYLCAGMPVIATATSANKEIIRKDNGITIGDDVESFSKGIEAIINNCQFYDSVKIRQSIADSTWECVVDKLKRFIIQKIS